MCCESGSECTYISSNCGRYTERGLLISSESKEGVREGEIDLGSLTESAIRTVLTNSYRLGYDKIKINFRDKRALRVISNVVDNQLIGFEIIKKGGDHCIIENIFPQ